MIRVYLKKEIAHRNLKWDDVASLPYVGIDRHPFSPIPINWNGIEKENVAFVTFGQQFTGGMQQGLYRWEGCEAYVSGGATHDDRNVILKAPTFDLVKEMWTLMRTELEPYIKLK